RGVDLPRQPLRLLGETAIGQVAGEEEHVAGPAGLGEELLERALGLRRLGVVEVSDGADPHRSPLGLAFAGHAFPLWPGSGASSVPGVRCPWYVSCSSFSYEPCRRLPTYCRTARPRGGGLLSRRRGRAPEGRGPLPGRRRLRLCALHRGGPPHQGLR